MYISMSITVMMKMKEKMENVGQKVNLSMSKNVSLLGSTMFTFALPPSSGWLAKALLA